MTERARWTWEDTRRGDGLVIRRSLDAFVIIPVEGEPLAACPCCNRPMTTLHNAMLVADAVYPPPGWSFGVKA